MLVAFFLLCACNGDNVPDCFQNEGERVSEVVPVDAFDRIFVFENIELVLIQGEEQRVEGNVSKREVADRPAPCVLGASVDTLF